MDEWIVVALMCGAPFALYGVMHLLSWRRRRADRALAHRSKGLDR